MSGVFPIGWFNQNISENIDLESPGIYEWRIEGIGVYIGKSKRLRGRLKEYENNINKIVNERPYRKNDPNGFRVVHDKLHEGVARGVLITFSVLENWDLPTLDEREQYWIETRREDGDLPILNSNPATPRRRATSEADPAKAQLTLNSALEPWLPKIADWPDEDQLALVEAIGEIEALRTGRYSMSPEEEANVAEGLAEANRGEFVSEGRMASLWRRFGT